MAELIFVTQCISNYLKRILDNSHILLMKCHPVVWLRFSHALCCINLSILNTLGGALGVKVVRQSKSTKSEICGLLERDKIEYRNLELCRDIG